MKLIPFIKTYPVIAILLSLVLALVIYYILMVTIAVRPLNMINGRYSSLDKSWSEIEEKIHLIKIGTPRDSVKLVLGETDIEHSTFNGTTILSYQQYGTLAPLWVYDVEVDNDKVLQINSYDW